MSKSNGGQVIERAQQIASMLLEGYSRQQIVQYSSENWNVGERQADKYILKAKDIIKASIQRDVAYNYSLAVARLTELYRIALTKKDLRAAIAASKEIASLQSLYNNSEILNVEGELNGAFLTPLAIQKAMYETPLNKFLSLPENQEFKEKFQSFKYMEAFLEATKGKDVPEL